MALVSPSMAGGGEGAVASLLKKKDDQLDRLETRLRQQVRYAILL